MFILSRQAYFCQKTFLSRQTQTRVCRDETFVATKIILMAAPANDTLAHSSPLRYHRTSSPKCHPSAKGQGSCDALLSFDLIIHSLFGKKYENEHLRTGCTLFWTVYFFGENCSTSAKPLAGKRLILTGASDQISHGFIIHSCAHELRRQKQQARCKNGHDDQHETSV